MRGRRDPSYCAAAATASGTSAAVPFAPKGLGRAGSWHEDADALERRARMAAEKQRTRRACTPAGSLAQIPKVREANDVVHTDA